MTSHDIENCRKCFYLRIAAVVAWSAGLVILSLLPNSSGYSLFVGQDKFLHFSAYLLMAWLACRSLQLFSVSVKNSTVISAIYCVSLGGLLELMQYTLTRSRTAELNDMLANLAGAICGCAIFCLQQKLKFRNDEQP